jgi:ribonuclease P protein component
MPICSDMPPSAQRFGKDRRVRRRSEFTSVFEFALRAQGRYLTVLIAPNKSGSTRLGIVASRKLGDAVRRNRAKRLIREVFRRTSPGRHNVDVVVIPRRELFDAAYSSLEVDFRSTFNRCAGRLTSHGAR